MHEPTFSLSLFLFCCSDSKQLGPNSRATAGVDTQFTPAFRQIPYSSIDISIPGTHLLVGAITHQHGNSGTTIKADFKRYWVYFRGPAGTTANKGTRDSLVRMTQDVVTVITAGRLSIRVFEGIWINMNWIFFWKGLFSCKVSLYRAYILEKSSLGEMKGIWY